MSYKPMKVLSRFTLIIICLLLLGMSNSWAAHQVINSSTGAPVQADDFLIKIKGDKIVAISSGLTVTGAHIKTGSAFGARIKCTDDLVIDSAGINLLNHSQVTTMIGGRLSVPGNAMREIPSLLFKGKMKTIRFKMDLNL